MGRGDIDCEYTLKEIYAPEGYVPSEDIKFRAYNDAIDGYRLGFECTPERDFSVGDGKVDLTIEDFKIHNIYIPKEPQLEDYGISEIMSFFQMLNLQFSKRKMVVDQQKIAKETLLEQKK